MLTILVVFVATGLRAETLWAQTSNLTAAFQTLRTNALWPVSGSTFDAVESTFGPRIKASSRLYDWHRGIDIDAPEGTPVLATLDGTLFDITTYTAGGLTVILKHNFAVPVVYAGRTLNHFYTFHMHLSSVEPVLQNAFNAGQKPSVAKGAEIGQVGHSGTAIGDHLHWELRAGTPYSLEWQIAHPTSQYGVNNFGFDPHMHPMLLTVPFATSNMTLSLTTKPSSRIDGKVRFSCLDDQPLLNRFDVRIVRKSSNTTVALHTLDFNERLGFNASTNAALDTQDKTKPYISPISFGNSAASFTTDLVIPKTWVGANSGANFLTTVAAYDIWGRSKILSW
jgi:murein DD-endopeptidase MepM/ murein hydrolase activator NlpD